MTKDFEQQVAVISSEETLGLYDDIVDCVEAYALPPSTTIGILEIVKSSIMNSYDK